MLSNPRFERSLRSALRLLALVTVALCSSPSGLALALPARSLTITTYNIHHAVGVDDVLDLERIATVLEQTGADVIALQEVDRHWSERSEFVDQAEELAARLGMEVVYGANLDNDPPASGAPRRQYGTAILTTHRILAWSNTPLPNLGGEQRGLLDVLLSVRGVNLRVLNTHLQHNSAAERAAQTEAIAARIDASREPVVLAGDLNARPQDGELDVIQTRLNDAWEIAGSGSGATYPSEAPDARIDYVFADRCLEVERARVDGSNASDHLPLTVRIELANRAQLGRCRDDVVPLARAHAHNDYEHARPLLDALEQGFASMEADIWLVDGELRVAHDLEQVEPGRTLEKLYLEPLLRRVRAERGSVHGAFPHSVQLLIDIKSDAVSTYKALHEVLARYASILTVFTAQGVREGAVTAVISGNRPRELMAQQSLRFAGYDGRSADLGSGESASFIPLISDNWNNLFTWKGEGTMPLEQRARLQQFVATAHANGQRVRFWATPEDPSTRAAVWSELVAAGADYVNTDDLAGLRTFLLANDPHPNQPEVDLYGPLYWFDWN